jgi:hypothetical protein
MYPPKETARGTEAPQTVQAEAQGTQPAKEPAAVELTPEAQDWYNKHREDNPSLVGKYPAQAEVSQRDRWLENAIQVAQGEVEVSDAKGVVRKLKVPDGVHQLLDIGDVDTKRTREQVLADLKAKMDSSDPAVSPREQQSRVERMNAKIVRGKRIAQILRNDSEAAQWLAAMERAKKADKETEFNTEFQKLLDAEEKQQLGGRKTKSTAEIVGEMEPGEDYGYEGTEGIDFSRYRGDGPKTSPQKIYAALREWFFTPEQLKAKVTVVEKLSDLSQKVRDRISESRKSVYAYTVNGKSTQLQVPGRMLDVTYNPSMEQQEGMLRRATDGILRVYRFGGLNIVWDAGLATHEDVSEALGILMEFGSPQRVQITAPLDFSRFSGETASYATKDGVLHVWTDGQYFERDYGSKRSLEAAVDDFDSENSANSLRTVVQGAQKAQFSKNTASVQAFVLDGRAYIIAENIPAGAERAVFMHEVGAHLGLDDATVDAAAARINAWANAKEGSVERQVYDATRARMSTAGETSNSELVAYATEEAVKAGVTPKAVANAPKVADIRTVQGLIDFMAHHWRKAVEKIFGKPTRPFTSQDLVDLTYGAAREALAKPEVGAGRTAMASFSKATAMATPQSANADFDAMVQSSEIMQEQPGPVRQWLKSMAKEARTVGILTTLRKYVADTAAPVALKIDAAFDGKVRDAMGAISPMGQYRQANDASKLMISFFETGAMTKDLADGQYHAAEVAGVPSMLDVANVIKTWGESTGKSFEQAYAGVSKMLEAVRHKALMDLDPTYRPNKLSNQDPRTSREQVAEGVRMFNATPEAKRISGMLDKIRFRLVDQMVETGRLTKDEGKFWKDASGYVPFDRVKDFSTKFRSLRSTGSGVAQLGKLPKFIGSTEREVGNIIDNYTKLNGWMVGQVLKQDANTNLFKHMADLGWANKPVRAESMKAKAIPAEKRVTLYIDGVEHVGELVSQYDQAAFNEMGDIKSAWIKMFQKFANVLRTTITAMPPFAAKQVTDDIQRAFFTSGVQNPSHLIIPSLRNFFAISLSELQGKRHPYLREFGRKSLTGEYDLNTSNPAETILQDFGFRQRGTIREIFHRLEGITRASDLAVRKAIYDQTMKETHDAALAQTRAREFINFRRHGAGSAMPALTATIPFFNAFIQGTDVLLRAATGKDSSMAAGRKYAQSLFIMRATQLMALSAIYALAMGDDEDYQEASLQARGDNWILPGGVKISVPSEIGALFKVPVEMAFEYMRRQGTPEQMEASEAAITALSYAAQQYGGRMMPIPAAVKPVIEAFTNYSFFTGRPIVGAFHKQLEPSLQRADRTSELAIAISEFSRDVVGVDKISPLLVDNFLQGYFGTVANLMQMTTDGLLNPDRLDRPVHKYWLLSNYLYDPIGTRRVTEFYDLREKTSRVQATLRELVERDPERAEKYALDHESELALAVAVNSTLEQLSNTRQYKKFLASRQAAEEMSQEERTHHIEETRKLEMELVRWVREIKAEMKLR